MVRPNSVSNNLTRITKALQAWQINWNIHGVHIPLANPVNNLAIPLALLWPSDEKEYLPIGSGFIEVSEGADATVRGMWDLYDNLLANEPDTPLKLTELMQQYTFLCLRTESCL